MGGLDPTTKLGLCEGDCDDDDDCMDGYRCFFRKNTDSQIPYGCFVGDADVSNWDLCVNEATGYKAYNWGNPSSNKDGMDIIHPSGMGMALPGPNMLDFPMDEPDEFVVELHFTSKWMGALFVAVLALTVAAFVALCCRKLGQGAQVASYSKVGYVSETEA